MTSSSGSISRFSTSMDSAIATEPIGPSTCTATGRPMKALFDSDAPMPTMTLLWKSRLRHFSATTIATLIANSEPSAYASR